MDTVETVKYNKNEIEITDIPQEGENVNVFSRPGDKINLGFEVSDAEYTLVGGDIVAALPGGATITFVSMGIMALSEDAPVINSPGSKEPITMDQFLTHIGEVAPNPQVEVETLSLNQTEQVETKSETTKVVEEENVEIEVVDTTIQTHTIQNTDSDLSMQSMALFDNPEQVNTATTPISAEVAYNSERVDVQITETLKKTSADDGKYDSRTADNEYTSNIDPSEHARLIRENADLKQQLAEFQSKNIAPEGAVDGAGTGNGDGHGDGNAWLKEGEIISEIESASKPRFSFEVDPFRSAKSESFNEDGVMVVQGGGGSEKAHTDQSALRQIEAETLDYRDSTESDLTIHADDTSAFGADADDPVLSSTIRITPDTPAGFYLESVSVSGVPDDVDLTFVNGIKQADGTWLIKNSDLVWEKQLIVDENGEMQYEDTVVNKEKDALDLEFKYDLPDGLESLNLTFEGTFQPIEGTALTDIDDERTFSTEYTVQFKEVNSADDLTYKASAGESENGFVLPTNYNANIIYDSAGNTEIIGGAGKDTVYMTGGINTVNLADGDDRLVAGQGENTLMGGEGSDTLDYSQFSNFTLTQINDLNTAFDDKQLQTGEMLDRNFYGTRIDMSNGTVSSSYMIDTDGDDVGDEYAGLTWSNTELLKYDADGNLITAGLEFDSLSGTSVDSFSGFENVTGSDYNDIILGNAAANIIDGGAGSDTIDGGAGNNTLYGGAGYDTIILGSGNETVYGGTETDKIDLSNATGGATVYLHEVNDEGFQTISADGIGTNKITQVEDISGSDYADIIIGDGMGNYLEGGRGDDTIYGNGGIDFIDGGDGVDAVDYSYDSSKSYTEALQGISINLHASDFTIVRERASGRVVDLVTDVESVTGTEYGDWIRMSGYKDGESGLVDSGTVYAGGGGDTIDMRNGNDTVYAGSGNDMIYMNGFGDDKVDGGEGIDTLRLYNHADAIKDVDMTGGTDADGFYLATGTNGTLLFKGIEKVIGNELDNIFTGDANDNYFNGAAGDDTIKGGAGNDTIQTDWNQGNDIIDGGDGSDTVSYYNTAQEIKVTLDGANATTIKAAFEDQEAKPTSTTAKNATDVTISNVENIIGSKGHDQITGDANDNILRGERGNDTLIGGAGNDIIDGGAWDLDNGYKIRGSRDGDDFIDAGDGDDTIISYGGRDTIDAGDGDDHIYVQTHSDIQGGDGHDTLHVENHINLVRYARTLEGIEAVDISAGKTLSINASQMTGITELTGDGNIVIYGSHATQDTIDISGIDLTNFNGMVTIRGYNQDDIIRVDESQLGDQLRIYGDGHTDTLEVVNSDGTQSTLDSSTFLYKTEKVQGSSGDDYIETQYHTTYLDGGAGNDMLVVNRSMNEIDGGAGDSDHLEVNANVDLNYGSRSLNGVESIDVSSGNILKVKASDIGDIKQLSGEGEIQIYGTTSGEEIDISGIDTGNFNGKLSIYASNGNDTIVVSDDQLQMGSNLSINGSGHTDTLKIVNPDGGAVSLDMAVNVSNVEKMDLSDSSLYGTGLSMDVNVLDAMLPDKANVTVTDDQILADKITLEGFDQNTSRDSDGGGFDGAVDVDKNYTVDSTDTDATVDINLITG